MKGGHRERVDKENGANGENTMTDQSPIATNPSLFATIYQQNWENIRHIKSERIWFMNTYALISAGALSLLQNVRGDAVLQLSLLLFMCLFSLIGLLTSLRLKAELEECLEKVQAMALQAQVEGFVALGKLEGHLSRYPKFRWIFPVFYSMATTGFVALFVYHLVAGKPTR
jgi:hypothetical protein